MGNLINSQIKALYKQKMDLLLQDNALTIPCVLVYGDTRFVDCVNCKILPNGRSANIYQEGGPIPFNQGVCPFCNSAGKIAQESQEEVYLGVIEDSKDWQIWSKNSVSPHNPKSFIQTISKRTETHTKILRAKHLIVDTSISDIHRSKYERYQNPILSGLGNKEYIVCMWKKI